MEVSGLEISFEQGEQGVREVVEVVGADVDGCEGV